MISSLFRLIKTWKYLWVQFLQECHYVGTWLKDTFFLCRRLLSPSPVNAGWLETSHLPPSTPSLCHQLDQGIQLPSPPLSQSPNNHPVTPCGANYKTSIIRQCCHPSNKKMAAQMKLKLQMRKPLQKHGRTVAMEEVAMEERRTQMHDVFGSKDCFLDPIPVMWLIVWRVCTTCTILLMFVRWGFLVTVRWLWLM